MQSGEDGLVDLLNPILLAEHEAAARSAQCLVGGARHEFGQRHGVGMLAGCDQAGDVGHVHHQQSLVISADLGEPREIDLARVSAGACNHELGAMFPG